MIFRRVRKILLVFLSVIFLLIFQVFSVEAVSFQSFHLSSKYANQDFVQVREVYSSQRCRIFSSKDSSKFPAIGKYFDTIIYSKETSVFGSEWKPGIDNDPRVYILFVPLKDNIAGYFNSIDEYSRKQFENSNQHEMIYLNQDILQFPQGRINAYLSHEFQHLISFNQKERRYRINDDIWLNEARSEYAPTLVGADDNIQDSNLKRRIAQFIQSPSDSLIEWNEQPADYGQVNLFIHYLVNHYGGTQILTKIIQSPKTGIESINDALKKLGYQVDFSNVFTDWAITNLVNNCSILPQNKYCYGDPHLNYQNIHLKMNNLGRSQQVQVKFQIENWSAHWIMVDSDQYNRSLEIDFYSDSQLANFRIPLVIYRRNGQKGIKFLPLKKGGTLRRNKQEGKIVIDHFGRQVKSVAIIPSEQFFSDDAAKKKISVDYHLEIHLLSLKSESKQGSEDYQTTNQSKSSSKEIFPNSSAPLLIRARGDSKVYLVKNGYKHWLSTPEIFNSYGYHWTEIKEIEPVEMEKYPTSTLIQPFGDYRVYQIDFQRGITQWLDISPTEFIRRGYNWNQVFKINQKEFNLLPNFQKGSNIGNNESDSFRKNF